MRRAVAVLFLAGCFSTDPGSRRFPCDENHGCPPGQSCQNKLCQDEAAPLDAAWASDQSVASDLSPTRCAGTGYPVGTKGVWACLGTFSPAKPASSLCLNGKLCSDITGLVTKKECESSPNGLYGIGGKGSGPDDAQCANQTSELSLWYGCGIRVNSAAAINPCRGFTQVHSCSTLTCNKMDLSLNAQTNNDPNAGVLCCP